MIATLRSAYRSLAKLSKAEEDDIVVYNISDETTEWVPALMYSLYSNKDRLAPIVFDVGTLYKHAIKARDLLDLADCHTLLLIDHSPSSASSNPVPTVGHIPEQERFPALDNIREQERPKVVNFTTIASTSRTIPPPPPSLEEILESILVKQEKDKPSLADLTNNNVAHTPTDIASAPEWMRSYVSDMKRRREIIPSVRHVCESFQLARTLTYIQESRASDFDSVLSNPRTNEVRTQISRLFVCNDGPLLCTNLGQNTNSRKEECASWHRASNLSCQTKVWTEDLFLKFLTVVYTAPFSQRNSRYTVHPSLEM